VLGQARDVGRASQRVDHLAHALAVDVDHAALQGSRQFARRTQRRALAVPEHADPVAAHGFVHVVRGDEHRRPGCREREELRPEVAAALWIDPGGRLVEHEQLRLVNGGGREREPLFPAARQHRRAQKAVGLEVRLREYGFDAAAPAGASNAEDLRGEVEILEDREILVEREALCHVADGGAQPLDVAGHLEPEQPGSAGGGQQQTEQHPQKSRFAGAVGSKEAEDLAAVDVEVHAVDRRFGAEEARQPARLDHDRARSSHLRASSFVPETRKAIRAGAPARNDAGASSSTTRVS